MNQLVDKLELNDKVTFYGNVTDNRAWYDNIDIFLSNGYSEGWQVSLIEAMASGCYCLSHQWAGADEYLPPENLYFTGFELQQRVLAYCAMPEAEKQQQIACLREKVEANFDMTKTKVQIRELVENAEKGAA